MESNEFTIDISVRRFLDGENDAFVVSACESIQERADPSQGTQSLGVSRLL